MALTSHLWFQKRGRNRTEYVHQRYLPIPTMVDEYNHFMNGVDIADQLRAKFSTQQRTMRTWMSLFTQLLDMTLVNAYILSEYWRKSKPKPYKQVRGTHRAFRENLVDGLLHQYKTQPVRIYTTSRQLPTSRHDQPLKIHQKTRASYPGKCYFCRFTKDLCQVRLGLIDEAKSASKVRGTEIMCSHCGVFLCTKCFSLFHNFKSIQ
jgi:hypothetical protein